MFEFHISRQCRERYDFDLNLFQLNGNVILTEFSKVKEFARKLNQQRKIPIKPSELNAMGLIDEILHFVIQKYQNEKNPRAFQKALRELNKIIGKRQIIETMERFVQVFPSLSVYTGKESVSEYLQGKTSGIRNDIITIQEMLLLYLANENPAFSEFQELFDDTILRKKSAYIEFFNGIEEFFNKQPGYGPYNQPLIELLRAPSKASPRSLAGQLLYIKEHWGMILSAEMMDKLTMRILLSLDFLKEESKQRPGGPGPAQIIDFTAKSEIVQDLRADEARFSPDTDWMPGVVMIAKHIYVWLYQLSIKYNRKISKLDEIPDEELQLLFNWGFNALWLIGVWERSRASAKIKQLCGNPEAIASAYSVYDYVIAQDLGGEEAFNNLKYRASKYNIRIAVDMVPNHTAIDSKWIIEHPDWFIQTDKPPFYSYRFNGPDLSSDPRVEIYIEDGYYNRTDAGVVFKLVEKNTGRTRYIYHGNDGTGTPWNDTAQLNFLLPEVREAVIRKIIDISHKSPIIRLDAAMTLTKRHYHRLWFPEPGKGGDIPSRTEYSMTHSQFNKLFPREFWREVVDRIAVESPDTLLLAEAFWLMEGYFVRNLGMHRVYNSAFMNMLKMEQNKEYHQVLKNMLDYNPEILRRYVNFMSNPDELTAVQQFGKDDKYFGVCIMMVTMPGLCMFAHGQIEGFQEKYGMEYRRAYWNEVPDEYFMKRHEREIFPLLKKRAMFSGVENFVLYDFCDEYERINDNVFVYSNGSGNERILVVFNNRYQEARGWIRKSARYRHALEPAQGLQLQCQNGIYYSCKDLKNNLCYLIDPVKICNNGWYVKLGAYKYHVFADFREIKDNQSQDYKKLYEFLENQGFVDMNKVLVGMQIYESLKAIRDFSEITALYNDNVVLNQLFERIINHTEEFKSLLIYSNLIDVVQKGNELLMQSRIAEFFKQPAVKEFMMVNTYENIEWFNKERFELMLAWCFLYMFIENMKIAGKPALKNLRGHLAKIEELLTHGRNSGYQFQKLLNMK